MKYLPDMANPIVQQITTELENLHKELEQFKNTTNYLNGAKQYVEKAVQTVNHSEANFEKRIADLKDTYESIIKLTEVIGATIEKIDTINFPERLDTIEKTVKETVTTLKDTKQATLDELRQASKFIIDADFDGKFKNLKEVIDENVNANEALKDTIISSLDKLLSEIKSELNRIETSTNLSLTENKKFIQDLNLPIRLDKLDANIAGIMAGIQNTQSRLDSLERSIGDKIRDNHASTQQNISILANDLKSFNKKQQLNAWITWGLLVLIGGVLIFLIA